MHANSAARIQALHYLGAVLATGATLFAFDCAGSGISDGEDATSSRRSRGRH